MKGLLLWTYIVTFLTIIMIIFFIQTVFGSIDENVRISAQLNAEEIAAVINIMQASPSKIEYTIPLPKTECFVKIDQTAVRFATPKSQELKSTKDFSLCNDKECFTAYIAATRINIDIKNIIECKETKLTLAKCSNKIIKGSIGDCA